MFRRLTAQFCQPIALSSACAPLFLEKLNYRLLKCRLVRRRAVVAFTPAGASVWNCLEKAGNLLIGDIRFSIEYQNRYVDCMEGFGPLPTFRSALIKTYQAKRSRGFARPLLLLLL
jgi:hypothetical protein